MGGRQAGHLRGLQVRRLPLFATDVITGGPNYMLSYLDTRRRRGLAAYAVPYKETARPSSTRP